MNNHESKLIGKSDAEFLEKIAVLNRKIEANKKIITQCKMKELICTKLKCSMFR